MRKSQIISGADLVAKGATKLEVTLPELGIKNVVPNGSWLEQKQIQSALEARKHLIEVPRIEKGGTLSHANWNEEKGLAEVTQQTGGYWQWYGHHKQKQLYLLPEEALFLMETNCLHLKYNEVTVSLQQAYSLLLRGPISPFKYKVYASLSRVGYKVYRHVYNKKENEMEIINNGNEIEISKCNENSLVNSSCEGVTLESPDVQVMNANEIEISKCDENSLVNSTCEGVTLESPNVQAMDANEDNTQDETEIKENISISKDSETVKVKCESKLTRKDVKLQELLKRCYKTINRKKMDKFFEKLPEMSQVIVVNIKVPEETFLPRNIFLNKTNYLLKLDNIRNTKQPVTDNRVYSFSDVNEAHVRRIRGATRHEPNLQNNWAPPQFVQNNYPRFQQFWSYNHHRPRNPGQYLFNVFLHRPFAPQINLPRFVFWQRNPMPFYPPQRFLQQNERRPSNVYRYRANENASRKRGRSSSKQTHLNSIKGLVGALKQMVSNGHPQEQNFQALHRLLNTFNIRYKTRLRMNDGFELVNEDTINIDTIELDDDEEPQAKVVKPNNMYNENIKSIQQLANSLKELSSNGKACSRHRRAFLNMIHTFNKCYKADVYCDYNYEIINRNQIILDSSDSDCVIEETTPTTSTSKMYINPFNALNKKIITNPSTSQESVVIKNTKFTEYSRTFKNWWPKENDFGRAEIVSKEYANDLSINVKHEEYLFEFMKNYNSDYNDWTEVKMCFWESIHDESDVVQDTKVIEKSSPPKSLVKPGEMSDDDMMSVLEKLRVIKNCKTVTEHTNLKIDFDVYNRDVADFRKSNKPAPHFTVLCVRENSPVTSGEEITTLYSKYRNNIPIVFAVVGSSSISYLQMKPNDLPVYVPPNDVL